VGGAAPLLRGALAKFVRSVPWPIGFRAALFPFGVHPLDPQHWQPVQNSSPYAAGALADPRVRGDRENWAWDLFKLRNPGNSSNWPASPRLISPFELDLPVDHSLPATLLGPCSRSWDGANRWPCPLRCHRIAGGRYPR